MGSSSLRTGTTGRAASSIARPGVRSSSVRPPATYASRIDRAGAVSPADSLMSTATTGTKRKEREFEAEVGGEETNINVVVRCRGRNDREIKENSAVVVNTDGIKGENVKLHMGANALNNKTYNFDRVYSPAADQTVVFDDTVKPILEEVCCSFLQKCVVSDGYV
jgi:kinesin family member 11